MLYLTEGTRERLEQKSQGSRSRARAVNTDDESRRERREPRSGREAARAARAKPRAPMHVSGGQQGLHSARNDEPLKISEKADEIRSQI